MNKDPKEDDGDKNDSQEDVVVTPGGPRPRKQVHRVGPDQMLVFDDDGNPVVAPRPEKSSKE